MVRKTKRVIAIPLVVKFAESVRPDIGIMADVIEHAQTHLRLKS
jgi:hypothetical protein